MNKLHNITIVYNNLLPDIKNILIGVYGVGVTIHLINTTRLVFSIPAISNKVMEIFKDSEYYMTLGFKFGDSFSNDTLVNPMTVLSATNMTVVSLNIVTMDEGIVISQSSTVDKRIMLIDKTTDGDTIGFGLSSDPSLSTSVSFNNREVIFPIVIGGPFVDDNGYIYKSEVQLRGPNGKRLKNVDGTISSLKNIKSCSYSHNTLADLVLGGSIFFKNTIGNVVVNTLPTSLMIQNIQ